METKGKWNGKRVGAWALAFSGLTLLLTGCVHWPDINSDCEAYGVAENHQPMGRPLHVQPLYHDELDVRCMGAKNALAMVNPDAEIRGCVIPIENGQLEAYYSVGDHCAKNHELCHAMHGREHTDRYERELKNGIPMPYCPQNQLKF